MKDLKQSTQNGNEQSKEIKKIPLSLNRCLSLWEVVVYGVGLILGAGIYVLIGGAAGIAGNMIWLSFIIAAAVAGLTAMSYAELSTIFPKSGAEFVYAKSAFESEAVAWAIGIIAVIIGITTASTVAVGFAKYFVLFIPASTITIAGGLILAMSILNFWGIEESARFNLIATSIEVGGLLLVIVFGAIQIWGGTISVPDLLVLPENSGDSAIHFLPVVSAGALIFFAFIGFEDIANIAEEAEEPKKILPKAFLYSLLISTLLYVLVAIVAVSVVPHDVLAASDQPLSKVMERLIGGHAPTIIALIALFATANTTLISLIVGARMLFGMARERSLPGIFGRIQKKQLTPWFAVIVMGIASLSFLAFEEIEVLASFSNFGVFLLFLSVNMSNIFLRYRRPELNRPWKTPLNIGSFPIVSALGALSCVLMLFTIDQSVVLFGTEYSSLVVALVIFSLPFPLYLLYKRMQNGVT